MKNIFIDIRHAANQRKDKILLLVKDTGEEPFKNFRCYQIVYPTFSELKEKIEIIDSMNFDKHHIYDYIISEEELALILMIG